MNPPTKNIGSVANPTNTTVAFTWTNPPSGHHSLSARATDAAGLTEESSARTMTVTYPAGTMPVFSFAQADHTVVEGAGTVTLTVVKNPSPAAAISLATANGSARARSGTALGDYNQQSGSLNFAAGQLSASIMVAIVNDEGFETNQTFTVALSTTDPNVVVTNPAVATVLIIDDDPAPTTDSASSINPAALPDASLLGALQVGAVCTNLPGIASTNVGQWRLRWDTIWRNSGTVLDKLQPGSYDIVFQSRDGFTTPAPQTVTLGAGATLAVTGRDRVALGSDAVAGTVSNLVTDPYVVEFDTLSGSGYHRLLPSEMRVYPNFAGTVRHTFPAHSATWNRTEVPYARVVTAQGGSGEPHAFNGQLLGEGATARARR